MPTIGYIAVVKRLIEDDSFIEWFTSLKDTKTKLVITKNISKLRMGIGDTKVVGGGVSELRIHYGAGYRVYYMVKNNEIIILLCGGDKGSQDKDIEKAKNIADKWR